MTTNPIVAERRAREKIALFLTKTAVPKLRSIIRHNDVMSFYEIKNLFYQQRMDEVYAKIKHLFDRSKKNIQMEFNQGPSYCEREFIKFIVNNKFGVFFYINDIGELFLNCSFDLTEPCIEIVDVATDFFFNSYSMENMERERKQRLMQKG